MVDSKIALVTARSLLAHCSPFDFAFYNNLMNTPNRTTAAAFSRYAAGEVVADSASLQWKELFVRRYRFPNVVDRFLVPATPEPLISCTIAGSAEFREREIGEAWLTRQIGPGHIFVTRSKTPYEVCHTSPVGEELEIVQVHIAVDRFLAALEAAFPGKTEEVEVMDYSGRDEALAHLCFACAEMLSARTPGKSRRVADLAQLFASYLVEKYIAAAAEKPDFHSGLPIWRLRKVEDYVRERLAEEISVETLAELVELSPFHFLPRVQAGDRNVTAPVCHARADHPRAAAHSRNLAQPHRDRRSKSATRVQAISRRSFGE